MTTIEEIIADFRADLGTLAAYAVPVVTGLVSCRGHIADPFLDDDEGGVVAAEAPRPLAEIAHELCRAAAVGAEGSDVEIVNVVGLAAGVGTSECVGRSRSSDAAERGAEPPPCEPDPAAEGAGSGAPASTAAAASAAERGQRRRGKRGGKKHR